MPDDGNRLRKQVLFANDGLLFFSVNVKTGRYKNKKKRRQATLALKLVETLQQASI